MSQNLYDLPEGWEWVTVKQLSNDIQYGHTAKACEQGNAKFLRITDIQDGYINWSVVPYVSISESDVAKYSLNDNDLVFARTGATSGKSILIKNAPKNAIFASYLIRIVPNKDMVEPSFLAYFFQTPTYWSVVASNAAGAAQPNINGSKLAEFELPLPPLAEQTRIVEKLDAVLSRIDTAIDELQQSLALVDAMFRSGLDKAFNPLGSPTNEAGLYDLPDGWGWHLVKDISQNIQYGHTAKATDSGNAGFLRITDIQDGMINWSGVPFVEVSEKELTKYELQKNDLVFARSGATAGKSILIDEPPKNVIFASYLIRIIPNQLIVFPKYLALFFQSPMYWSIVMQNASGAAQPNINGTKLGEFSVPLPNLAEQQRVVEALDALNDKTTQLKTELTAKIGMFNQLKASVLDGAFRGLV